ncbi:MAG TPA: type II secretion system F family protein [Phycisphaerales bacterium]|nr:type II secretion system F family protein [Phycisphaerales bacterium]
MSRAGTPSSFLFLAATPKGGRTLGMRQARSERALAEGLRRDRLVLLRTWRLPGWVGAREGALALKDQAELNTQLALLLKRGVPLVEALEVTASVVSARTKPLVQRLRDEVAGGASFSDACRRARAFDTVTIAVYQAAERTGDLAGAAAQLSRTARRQVALRGKALTLMLYPAIVLAISILVVGLMLVMVVPSIGNALLQMTDDLPGYTKLIMAVSEFARANAPIVLAVVGAFLVLLLLARRQVGAAVARAMRKLPGVRTVALTQESARFFAVLAAMTRSGVPLADALGVATEAIAHPVMRRQLRTLRTRLIEGGVLRTLIDGVETLPLATRRLLMAAERAGDLESAFDTLADDLADETERRSTRLLSVLQPALIVAMFVIIGSILMAVMLPLLTLPSKVI